MLCALPIGGWLYQNTSCLAKNSCRVWTEANEMYVSFLKENMFTNIM